MAEGAELPSEHAETVCPSLVMREADGSGGEAVRAALRDRALRAVVIVVLTLGATAVIVYWVKNVNPVDFLVYRYAS
ncbi:MAG TPA: hypothetical protein VF834_13725, partial [Streptosporangiaceae bacterium]